MTSFDMFDAQTVLDAVDADAAPHSWKVYRATKSYFVEQAATLCSIAFMLFFIGVGAVALGIFVTLDDDQPLRYFSFLAGPVCVLMAYAVASQGFRLLRQTGSAPRQMLILTPSGFVVRIGSEAMLPIADSSIILPARAWVGVKSGGIFSVRYDKMASADLDVQHARYETRINLILTFVAPQRIINWRIDPRFPSRDTIAQSIIEAHAWYEAQHANGASG